MASRKIDYNGLRLKVGSDERLILADFESSNLLVLAYNVSMKQVIAVFKSSTEKRYLYNAVPPKTFFKVLAADSVGSAFNKEIVKGGFDYYDEPNK